MIYCLFLFWKDINVSFSKANEDPIAVIYFKKNTAQRKLIDGNIWERIKTATPIYNGDKIRTAALSEAYTIFNDSSKIDLHENTLIQVFNKKDKNSIEFVSGSISILSTENNVESKNKKEQDKSFQINTGNKILSFDSNTSATISISSKNSSQAVITVTSGEVFMEERIPVVETPAVNLLSNIGIESIYKVPETANLTTISAGSSYEFDTIALDQQLKEILSEFTVTMPTSTYSVTVSNTKKTFVPFFWGGTKDIQLDFAKDSAFEELLNSRTLTSTNGKASVSIDFAKDEKVIYWRAIPLPLSIETKEQQRQQFPQGVIFIHQSEEIALLEPIATVFGDEAAIQMEKQIQSRQNNANIQLLEIINPKEQEKEVPVTTETKAQTPVEPVVNKEETKTKVPAAEPKATAPNLVNLSPKPTKPTSNQIITEDDLFSDDPYIFFSWDGVKGSDSYLLEIFDSNNKKILRKDVKSVSYTVKNDELALFDNGEYTWKITAKTTVDGQEYKSITATSKFSISIGDIEDAEVDTENLLQ